MSLAHFQLLLSAFGNTLGLVDLQTDEEAYVGLVIDDLPVHLQYVADDDAVLVFSRIGEVDNDRREQILAWLLESNLFWQGADGATFAIEAAMDVVFIQNRLSMVNPNEHAFETWLGRFVDQAHRWRERLAAANAGQPFDTDPATADVPMMDPMNLRV